MNDINGIPLEVGDWVSVDDKSYKHVMPKIGLIDHTIPLTTTPPRGVSTTPKEDCWCVIRDISTIDSTCYTANYLMNYELIKIPDDIVVEIKLFGFAKDK